MALTEVDRIEYQDYREIHVDYDLGIDDIALRSGDENSPFKTVTYVFSLFTLVSADNSYNTIGTGGKIKILITGEIPDSPSITSAFTNIAIQANKIAKNKQTWLTQFTIDNTGLAVLSGLYFYYFTKTNTGRVVIENCIIDQTIDIGGGEVEFVNCDLIQATCNITGTSVVKFNNCKTPNIACTSSLATVYINNCPEGGTINTSNCSFSIVNSQWNTSSSTISGVNLQETIITVGKKGANYTDLSSALNAITDNSNTKRYIIKVGSGIYTVDNVSLVAKQYVSIVGSGINNTVFVPSGSTVDGVTLGTNNDIRDIEFQNYGSNKYALKALDPSRINITNLRFINCDGNILLAASGAISFATINQVWIAGSFTYGISCSGNGANIMNADISDVFIDGGSAGTWYGVYVPPSTVVKCSNVNITKSQGTGSAYYINAQGVLTATGGTLKNCNYGFNFGLNNGACDVTGTGIIIKGSTLQFYNPSNGNVSKAFFQLSCDDYFAFTDISSKIRYIINAKNDLWVSSNLYTSNPKAYGSAVASNEFVTLGYIQAMISDYQVFCKAYISSSQNLGASDSILNFVKEYDPLNTFNDTDHRFYCPKAGKYRVTLNINMNQSSGGNQINFQPRLNDNTKYLLQDQVNTISAKTYNFTSTIYNCAAGDYINFTGYSSSTSTHTITTGQNNSWVSIEYLGF